MKARIKKTGEIVNIAPYARVELDICDSRGNPIALEYEDVEFLPNSDWSAFRREAAKDIMCAVLSVHGMWENTKYDGLAAACVKQADELIRQLKEDNQ